MTPKQYGQLAEWYAEGRAECLIGSDDWLFVSSLPTFEQIEGEDFRFYRRRPDKPPMPDEVWVPSLPEPYVIPSPACSREECTKRYPTVDPVRYVRADGVIPGERLQWRPTFPDGSRGEWRNLNASEYRFKP